MARTLDQLVQDALGAQMLQLLRVQAELEAAQDRITALEAENVALTTRIDTLKNATP
jgi:cell division protein FtsB